MPTYLYGWLMVGYWVSIFLKALFPWPLYLYVVLNYNTNNISGSGTLWVLSSMSLWHHHRGVTSSSWDAQYCFSNLHFSDVTAEHKANKTPRSLRSLAARQPAFEDSTDTLCCRLFSSRAPLLLIRCHCWSVKKNTASKSWSWIAFAWYWEWLRPLNVFIQDRLSKPGLSSKPVWVAFISGWINPVMLNTNRWIAAKTLAEDRYGLKTWHTYGLHHCHFCFWNDFIWPQPPWKTHKTTEHRYRWENRPRHASPNV